MTKQKYNIRNLKQLIADMLSHGAGDGMIQTSKSDLKPSLLLTSSLSYEKHFYYKNYTFIKNMAVQKM